MLKQFLKYHSLGNDFIIIDLYKKPEFYVEKILTNNSWQNFVVNNCKRHFGIGANGILIIKENRICSIPELLIFNRDGSQAEICLNGLRCAALHLHKQYNFPEFFKCKMGNKVIECQILKSQERDENPQTITQIETTEMPEEKTITTPSGKKFNGYFLNLENPHFVILSKIEQEEFLSVALLIESHNEFANKTNVEFAWQTGKNSHETLVYERGCGPTLACSSGASAVLWLLFKLNKIEKNQKIELCMPGGKLLCWIDENQKISLQAKAHLVFTGNFSLKLTNLF